MPKEKSFTVAQIADRLNADLVGDGAARIRDVAPLALADGQCLSWLGDIRYLPALRQTSAAAALVPLDLAPVPNQTLIAVADPDLAICDVLTMLAPEVPAQPAGVHPSAVVAPDARVDGAMIGPQCTIESGVTVGPGTRLHAGVFVGAHTTIGQDCVLWPNVVVREYTRIGDRVIIHPNSTIGADGFGYLMRDGRHVHIPQIGVVVIEDDVEIGANSAVDRARSGVTRLGRGTKIDNLVQIAHNCQLGDHCVVVAQTGLSGSACLGQYVVMAGRSGVADHVTIGDGAQIAAQSVTFKNVAPGAVLRGVPAEPIGPWHRRKAALRRLPELVRQVRELTQRVRELESPADDS
jgi:UDP-3-O-[3-hydroxymyristoyl] glucosamine N-acyltransferase